MPITQERMQALIIAGQDYQQALQRAIEMIQHSHRLVFEGANAEGEIARLAALIYETGLLKQPLSSHTTLATEARHFKKEAFRNAKRRDFLADQRRDKNVPRANTAPKTLEDKLEIKGQAKSQQTEQILSEAELADLLTLGHSNVRPEDQAKIVAQVEQEKLAGKWMEENKDRIPVLKSDPNKKNYLFDKDEDDNSGPIVGGE